MAWVSLVVVMILLYAPVVVLGSAVAMQGLTLLEVSAAIWLGLWLLLLALERAIGGDILSRLRLREGLLYAQRPYLSKHLAIWLALLVLVGYAVQLAQQLLDSIWRLPLPYHLEPPLVVAATLTLLAGSAFWLEACCRYDSHIRSNQQRRKEKQEAIARPGAYK